MAKAAELSHKSHTTEGPVNFKHILQFWVAFRCCAPEVVTELLRTADVDAWAKDRHLTLNDAVPAWVIRGAEEIRRLGRAAKLDRCPPDPPVAGTYSLTAADTSSDPDWWRVDVKPRVPFDLFWHGDQRNREKKKILHGIGQQIDAEYERIGRSFQLSTPWRDQRHFEWFVGYQVSGMEIRDLVKLNRESHGIIERRKCSFRIRKAVWRVAGLLGLSPANKEPGRRTLPCLL